MEIHGSWYDPSNPVVCMSGVTRRDLYAKLSSAVASADLVLVLGTSLSGLNSDQVPLRVEPTRHQKSVTKQNFASMLAA